MPPISSALAVKRATIVLRSGWRPRPHQSRAQDEDVTVVPCIFGCNEVGRSRDQAARSREQESRPTVRSTSTSGRSFRRGRDGRKRGFARGLARAVTIRRSRRQDHRTRSWRGSRGLLPTCATNPGVARVREPAGSIRAARLRGRRRFEPPRGADLPPARRGSTQRGSCVGCRPRRAVDPISARGSRAHPARTRSECDGPGTLGGRRANDSGQVASGPRHRACTASRGVAPPVQRRGATPLPRRAGAALGRAEGTQPRSGEQLREGAATHAPQGLYPQ